MLEEEIEIEGADGVCSGYVHRLDEQPRPGAIYLTDIGGIRPAQLERARKLAARGYSVLTPNLFYRTGRPPMFDFRPKPGDERTVKRFGELVAPLTPDALERDASLYVDFLGARPGVRVGAIGVVGHCFSGGVALRFAAARPDKVAAAASFHGGGLCSDAPTSPHLLLPRIKARLYFGHAIKDRSMPKQAIDKLDLGLAAWGGRFESEIYEGAYHGWTSSDAPIYNQSQADRALEKLVALFASAL